MQPNVKGDYSWLLTVTPAATEIGATNKRKFDVSVVVIFGRDLSHNPTDARPSERATAGIAGLGYGGGDGILIAPDKMKEADATEYLAVRQNEWVMVTGLACGFARIRGRQRLSEDCQVVSRRRGGRADGV